MKLNDNFKTIYNSKYINNIQLSGNFTEKRDNELFLQLLQSKNIFIEDDTLEVDSIKRCIILDTNKNLTTYKQDKKIVNYTIDIQIGSDNYRQTI